MATLYEITNDYLDLITQGFVVNEETGEIIFEETDLNNVQGALEDKLEAVACYIKNIVSDAEAIDEEAKKLKARSDVLKRKADRLRAYILSCMQMADVKKLETSKVALSTRKSSSVVVYDENKLKQIAPQVFVEQEPKLNKTLLKKVLQDTHGALDSCAAIQENINLQIK